LTTTDIIVWLQFATQIALGVIFLNGGQHRLGWCQFIYAAAVLVLFAGVSER
jgi:hypothetical protein